MTPLQGTDRAEQATVSTECPNCGAPLDFREGIHAIECHHCKTHFLITGRKRLQTYWVAPRVDAAAASRAAQPILGRGQLDAKRIFVPYYRLTAYDFFWCKPGSADLGTVVEGTLPLGWKALFAEEAPKDQQPTSIPKPAPRRSAATTGFLNVTEGLDLKIRRVDRTVIASVIERHSLFSLGFRAAALNLRLLRQNELQERGTVVPVSVPSEAAVRFLMRTFETVAMRTTVCQSLGLIYFPDWLIACGDRAVLVDGISGSVVDRDVPPSIVRELSVGGEPSPATIELRGLNCPNCGWDFPVRPEDVAFRCGSCEQGWQLMGAELQPIEAAVADVRLPDGQPAVYLPFWVLAKQTQGRLRQLFVPGFQYKNLRKLHQVASNLTGRQPQYTTGGSLRGEMIGCFYDEEDAQHFSQFLEERRPIGPGVQQVDEPAQRGVLTWIPFAIRGNNLVDPFLGFSNLTLNLLG